MNIPCAVEKFQEEHRNFLIQNIKKLNFGSVEQAFVVGTYCYYIPDPQDIDLIVVSPDFEFKRYRLGKGLAQNTTPLRKKLSKLTGLDCDLKVYKKWVEPYSDLGLLIPYYDLFTGKLHNKQPYKEVYFHFTQNKGEEVFTTRMRDKKTKAMDLLF